jgi:hypothetical protein
MHFPKGVILGKSNSKDVINGARKQHKLIFALYINILTH